LNGGQERFGETEKSKRKKVIQLQREKEETELRNSCKRWKCELILARLRSQRGSGRKGF